MPVSKYGTKSLTAGKSKLTGKVYRVSGYWDQDLYQHGFADPNDRLDFKRKADAKKYAEQIGKKYNARRVGVVLYRFDRHGDSVHREDAGAVAIGSSPKKAPKKRARPNRFSVRCHSYQGGYLMFEGSLTRAEADKVYASCKREGYSPVIFDGRKKIK